MSTASLGLSDELQEYLLDMSLDEPPICERLRHHTLQMEQSNMLSSPEQVQLLLLLAKMLDAQRGLEIGTFTGYTSLRLTLGMPALRMTCCDISEEYAAIARRYWNEAAVAERIDLHLAPAMETLDAMIDAGRVGDAGDVGRAADDGAFDFAYIDADKTGYQDYVERCLTLVRPGGLIALDNTLWSGRVADPADQDEEVVALRRLNSWLHAEAGERYDLSLVPIGDGLTLLRRTGAERGTPRG
jgi:predicted O-methyltransferase YrrM